MNRWAIYRSFIGGFAVSMLLFQCTYEPMESFHKTISEPEPLRISIDLQSPAFSDPFYLDFQTTFSFSVAKTEKKLADHVVILDENKPVASSVTGLGKVIMFDLNPLNVGLGTHKVTLYMAFETGSNSLAEQIGAEYYSYQISFNVQVDRDPPPLVTPLSARIENGYLTMRWQTTTNRPYRFIVNNGASSSIITNNFNPNFEYVYADSGYVGNSTNYALSISNAFGMFNVGTTSSPPYPTDFILNTSNPDKYSLEWSSTIYPAQVLLSGPKGSTLVPITTGKIDLDSMYLGDELNYRIIISRNIHQDQRFDSTFVLKKQQNMRPFNMLKTMSASNAYFVGQGPAELYRMTLPDFQVVDSSQTSVNAPHVFHEFQFSSDATFITTLSHGQSVPLLINPNDLKDTTPFNALMTNQNGAVVSASATKHTSASSNKLLGATIIYNGSPRPIIYDLNQDLLVSPFDAFTNLDSINTDTPLLSPDGNFYCLNSYDQTRKEVYYNNLGDWNLVGYMPNGEFTFRKDGSLELISIENSAVKVYDLSNLPPAAGPFQVIRTFSLPPIPAGSKSGKVGYDELSQMLTVETIDELDYSTIKLYAIQDFAYAGSVKARVKSKNPNIPVRHIYSAGYHFVSSGYAEKIIP